MSSLGERLKDLRKEKAKKSQKEFGEIFGLSESAIGMYERNQRKPDYETLEKFAEYLGTDVNYLITGEKVRKQAKFPNLTSKDEKDIAKRIDKLRRDLLEANSSNDGLSYMGEPMSEEAIDSLLEALEHAERITTIANKKYTPNKYKKKD